MTSRVALIGAVAALSSTTALAQLSDTASEKAPPACEGETFVFEAGPVGHVAKVTLCSKKDPTADELVRMFESAASTLSQNSRMAAEKRDDLVAQIRAKASEVRGGHSASATASLGLPAPNASLTPLRPPTPNERAPEYAVLPPLPAPKPAVAASAAASTSLTLSKPELKIQCFNIADLAGPGPCESLERETIVKVLAADAVPAGTTLRFMRRGDLRAEIDLAQVMRGKSTQFVLPRRVCSGVAESKVEIQIVRRAKASDAGQVVDSMGPYSLRC